MSDGRKLFANFLGRETLPRPAMVPFLDTLAARIAGNSYAEMINEPGLWTGALVKSAELLRADGVIAGFDSTILAEALGAAIAWNGGRPVVTGPADEVTEDPFANVHLAAAIETARRITAPAGRTLACVAALVGPQTLAGQVFGMDAVDTGMKRIKPHLAAVTEAFLKTQPDLLLFVERFNQGNGKSLRSAARVYSTLRNLADYYNVPAAIYADGYDTDAIHQITALKMDVYLLGRDYHDADPDLALALDLAAEATGAGIGIALDMPAKAGAAMQAVTAACHDGHNLLLTSLGAPDRDIDLNSVRSILNGLPGH